MKRKQKILPALGLVFVCLICGLTAAAGAPEETKAETQNETEIQNEAEAQEKPEIQSEMEKGTETESESETESETQPPDLEEVEYLVCTSDDIVMDLFRSFADARKKYCRQYVEVTGSVRDWSTAGGRDADYDRDTDNAQGADNARITDNVQDTEHDQDTDGEQEPPRSRLRLECSPQLDNGYGWALQTFVVGDTEFFEGFLTEEEYETATASLSPGDTVTVRAYVGRDGIDEDYGLGGTLVSIEKSGGQTGE